MRRSAVTARRIRWRCCRTAAASLCLLIAAGCYAPLHSPGIAASTLPDDFRFPQRTVEPPINFSTLVAEQPLAYLLGAGDVLEVSIPDLIAPGQLQVFQVTVLEHGDISLPRIGSVNVGGLSLGEAQDQVNRTLAAGFLQQPRATVRLIQKGTINVLVLGAVKRPGMHALPRYENDIAHALAAAEGFSEFAGEMIEVHRREAASAAPVLTPAMLPAAVRPAAYQPSSRPVPPPQVPARLRSAGPSKVKSPAPVPAPALGGWTAPYQDYRFSAPPPIKRPDIRGQSPDYEPMPVHPLPWPAGPVAMPAGPLDTSGAPILRIRLRGDTGWIQQKDVVLQPGDVVIIPEKIQEVFYVVGELSDQNRVRFAVNNRDREIGNGLLLPANREIDVTTAVAMAGYLDPIESPTTVTLHRIGPDGLPMLILIDLIEARGNPRENLLVQPGDIIYLNPDPAWYTRRLLDRVINQALGTAIGRWLTQ